MSQVRCQEGNAAQRTKLVRQRLIAAYLGAVKLPQKRRVSLKKIFHDHIQVQRGQDNVGF